VMARFGIPPGPEVGRLLERAREAQGLGLVTTREDALAYLDSPASETLEERHPEKSHLSLREGWRRLSMIALKILVAVAVLLLPTAAGAAPAGKIVIAQGVDPTTLDMANQSESPASNVGRHILDTLYERDQNAKIVPLLATEMPKFVPPSAWEVKLRKGVRFHNGEEFNADSVKFTLERLAQGQGKLPRAAFFVPID